MPTFDWSPNQACDSSSKCWVVVTYEDHELSLFGCDILVENEKTKRLPEIAASMICVRTYRRFISDLDCYPESIVVVVTSHLILFLRARALSLCL
ncbi:hypothetical protein HanXRQr2_Chr17g0781781 [Helianthus annuus]|uniref:Uncharacterized protein n=1 Tax=Helianthus annuus TaxID=4232 RepID=A0A9K3DF03_HELAN|nr:hypothetical protein HanXRQr2_Chr17g0781781 [Helianthus annuus]